MGIMKREQQDLRYTIARKRVKTIKTFYIHLAAFIFVNGFILMVNTPHSSVSEIFFEGNKYILSNFVLWAIVLLIHWASVFGADLVLSKKWEERKLQELMK